MKKPIIEIQENIEKRNSFIIAKCTHCKNDKNILEYIKNKEFRIRCPYCNEILLGMKNPKIEWF